MKATEPSPLLVPTRPTDPADRVDADIDPHAPERSLEALLRHLALQHPWLMLLVALLGAWFWSSMAMWLSRFPGQMAAIWYTNVWGLALLLVLPRRLWAGALLMAGLGIFGANLAYGDDLALATLLVLPNLAEMVLAAVLLLRSGDHQRLYHDPAAMLRVMLRGSLLPALMGTALASLLVELTGLGQAGQVAWGWLDSSAVGSATLLPITLALLSSERDTLLDQFKDMRTAALALVSVAVALLAILLMPFPYVYIVLPLVLGAMRLRFVAVAIAVALVSVTVGTLIAQGMFPAPPQTAQWQQLLLYTPLLAALMPPLLLAASAEQVRRQTLELGRSRERYRTLYERTPAMMVSVDRAGRLIGVSRLWLERMGLTREDTVGRRLDDFLTEPARLLALHFVPGDLLMVLAIISWAFYSWLLARPPAHMQGEQRPDWDWAALLLVQIGFSLPFCTLTAGTEALLGDGHWHWSPWLPALLLFVAIGPALIAYRCWGLGVSTVGPAVAAFFSNLTPLFAALMSGALLAVWPQWYHGVAFGLIVAGIVVSSRR